MGRSLLHALPSTEGLGYFAARHTGLQCLVRGRSWWVYLSVCVWKQNEKMNENKVRVREDMRKQKNGVFVLGGLRLFSGRGSEFSV